MRAMTEPEIRRSFVNIGVRERRELKIPGLGSIRWDELDFLAWRDGRSSSLAYLVVFDPDGAAPVGIKIRIAQPRAGSTTKAMCDLCRAHRSSGEVQLFVARVAGHVGRTERSVGVYGCSDFACSAHVRAKPDSGIGFPPETIPSADRQARLTESVTAFVRRVRGTSATA
jgi:hypothetical protein